MDPLLELDLQLDTAYVVHLILEGRSSEIDAHLTRTGFHQRLERYRRQRADRETLPQPPGHTS